MLRLLLLALALVAGPVQAQRATVVSRGPDRVALTVYRAPYAREAIDLASPGGFALVHETRRIRVPRGAATIRFEGVAAGIVPVSAVIDGLPGGTVEKNRDARLLSPASLIDGTLGRQVTLTRTDPATGRATREEATIVAGPERGVVLRTARGIEALRCSGLPERLGFAGIPPGLSDKPVLSVDTVSPAARTVTVRLSYLSSGFDWRASYVATLARTGDTIDLFAWLTLANANGQAFAKAEVRAVAGRLNRVWARAIDPVVPTLRLSCYPLGTTTSDLRIEAHEMADIIVTASRVMVPSPVMAMAPPAPPSPPPPPPPPPPEDLGDLKLYRVPGQTDVAPRAQKQVALLAQGGVPFERRYRRAVAPGQRLDGGPTATVLVLRNTAEGGLGVPLPAGETALYAAASGARLLLGLGRMTDRTTGERIRLAAGTSDQVTVTQVAESREASVLRVANANPFSVTLDLPIGAAGQRIEVEGEPLRQVDGIATWAPVLPPGGRAELRYRHPVP